MEINLITNVESCHAVVPLLLYYSHIPTAIVALLIGFFVFFKNKTVLINKILFGISLVFSLWIASSLITWLSYDSRIIMFTWSLFGILNSLLFILCLYFVYVFFDKRDVGFKIKIFFGILFFPIVILTAYNLLGFDVASCEAQENAKYFDYVFGLELLISFWILILSVLRYRKTEEIEDKKQIVLLTIGIELFLFSFFITGYLASYIDNFQLEQYGLFGMTFFMAMLAYLIVKFEAFNVKMIGAQALVIGLVVLIGSQFFFIKSFINQILTGITLILSIVFGWFLIVSVKKEIKQKEELEIANQEITQRKEQLQKMADSLSIANDKLRQLDQAKSDFVSMASHQLRRSPTSIKGFTSLMLEGSYGEINSEVKEVMEKIYKSNEIQIDFIEDLLNVSRLESGSLKFEFGKSTIEDLCQDAIDVLALKAKEGGLYLNYNKPKTPLPELMIDKTKIREVISNLVDNAIKYTKKGGVTLGVELCDKKQEKCLQKEHIRIVVSDTGIGVPAEEMPHLFSKFSRGKDTTRLNANGTGLGLYVVKMMTEGNGGKVWVESEGEGKGSRFIIELPLEQLQETIVKYG